MAEINDVLINPLKGFAPWAINGPYAQPHTLVFTTVTWKELEPSKNNFNWDVIETKYKLTYWGQRGVRMILNFVADGAGGTRDIPDYLYEEINHQGTSYGGGWSPNYSHPNMISNHARVINAIANKYDNDWRLGFVQIGSVGHWGECHTVNIPDKNAIGYCPPVDIFEEYIHHYVNAFKRTKCMTRRPFQACKDHGVGLYDELIGNVTETNRYIRYFQNGYISDGGWGISAGNYPAMPEFWKVSPSGGECEHLGSQVVQNAYLSETIREINEAHFSYMGPGSPADKEAYNGATQGNINTVFNLLGYRFVINNVTHNSTIKAGEQLPITIEIINRGVAPFYYRWPFEISLANNNGTIVFQTQTDEDIRTWQQGTKIFSKNITIPTSITDGTYKICAAIIDPDSNLPAIQFANTGKRNDTRYEISTLTVSGQSTIPPPVLDTGSNLAKIKYSYPLKLEGKNLIDSNVLIELNKRIVALENK